jgi:hypothetical protein
MITKGLSKRFQHSQVICFNIVTCMVLGFGLEIGFIDYLQVVPTSNYNAIANCHASQITTAHAKFFSVCCVFTSRFLVTASNSGDFFQLHRPNLFFLDSLKSLSQLTVTTELTSKLISIITYRLEPSRKHRSFLYSDRFRGNVFVCEGVTQYRLRVLVY